MTSGGEIKNKLLVESNDNFYMGKQNPSHYLSKVRFPGWISIK